MARKETLYKQNVFPICSRLYREKLEVEERLRQLLGVRISCPSASFLLCSKET